MIVGFTGRKRSGKDTAAAALVQEGFTRFSFAAPLKLMLRTLLDYQGVPEATIQEMLEGSLKEAPSWFLGNKSPRHAMQTLGTEWGRNLIGENFWVETLTIAARSTPLVVVSDVRFPNEVDAVRRNGGKVIRISRPGLAANDDHPSEALIDTLPVDLDVANDGGVVDLHRKIRSIVFQ